MVAQADLFLYMHTGGIPESEATCTHRVWTDARRRVLAFAVTEMQQKCTGSRDWQRERV